MEREEKMKKLNVEKKKLEKNFKKILEEEVLLFKKDISRGILPKIMRDEEFVTKKKKDNDIIQKPKDDSVDFWLRMSIRKIITDTFK